MGTYLLTSWRNRVKDKGSDSLRSISVSRKFKYETNHSIAHFEHLIFQDSVSVALSGSTKLPEGFLASRHPHPPLSIVHLGEIRLGTSIDIATITNEYVMAISSSKSGPVSFVPIDQLVWAFRAEFCLEVKWEEENLAVSIWHPSSTRTPRVISESSNGFAKLGPN